MTKVKLCGLSRICDIETANELIPDYIGFVFAKNSKRYVNPKQGKSLKKLLRPEIKAVGVFVNEDIAEIVRLINEGIIDIVQLHGNENEKYIDRLRHLTDAEIFQAFKITSIEDVVKAENSSADMILLDSGAGTGETFDWEHIANIKRKYFLAGGLSPENVNFVRDHLNPYGLDVSSGIETNGFKDKVKMAAFVHASRKELVE